jgi:hypothetical protein
VTAAATLALAAGALGGGTASAANPSTSPAWLHSHHRGAYFPTKTVYQANSDTFAATSADSLQYNGGLDGIGVTTGHEKVYLVLYGSQWGTASTGADGYQHYSGDPKGVAPRLQALFKGLGTNNERWSTVMTQYCEGVPAGTTTCPASAPHVAYPTGGALSGVWEDTSVASPGTATATQLANEAVKAARNAQYIVVSPTGTSPDGFISSGFCAWHSWNGNYGVSSPYGDVAFTNLPYIPDAGTACGMNYVNSGSAGTLDGLTMVGGHEYAETVTDQNYSGGWIDANWSENADKCAWNGVGGTGGASNLSFATGSYAMQATWSNSADACEITAPYDDLDDTAANWHLYYDGTGSGSVSQVSSPSQDGSALKISLDSGTPYLGVQAYQNLAAADSATSFTLSESFYFPNATPIQALEFSQDSWVQNTRYEWAMEWERIGTGVTTPVWRVWTGSSWLSLGIAQNLAAGAWHTFTLTGNIVNGQVQYSSFSCDGVSSDMGLLYNPVASTGDKTAVSTRLAGNSVPTPYALYVDDVSFAHN